MGPLKHGRLIIKRFFPYDGNKPLVGSQVTFAIRTIKAALNGKGVPQGNPDRPG